MEWLRQDFNDPSRTDHYLMTIASEVAKKDAKSPTLIKPENFKIDFVFKREDPEAQDFSTKSIWCSIVGYKEE